MSSPSVPSVEEVSRWKRAQVLTFLRSKKDELDLDDEDIDIVQKNKVAGRAFLNLTAEELERCGMTMGPAKTIVDLIKEIKGEREERGKRKAEGELTFAPKKRKWTVNSAITREERSIVYYADPTERNGPLLELIHRGEFVALYGPRASGKSTRVLAIQDQLRNEGFVCIYTSFEHVEVKGDIDTFWRTLGMALLRNAHGNGISVSEIDSAQGFLKAFQRDQWEHNVVLLFDEFDKLYRASEDVTSSCLETLRGIRNDKSSFAIFSVVAVGPFSILYLNSKELTTSPFNVRTPFQNPNFIREQVQTLYEEFMKEERITIDPEIIEDIYSGLPKFYDHLPIIQLQSAT
ncbi:4292_t:CDS:2, partial [Paraglomus occultum]